MGLLDSFKKPSIADLQTRGDVDGIVKLLFAQDGKYAMEAAGALAKMGGEKGVLALLKAVMDSSPTVRLAGAMHLCTVSDPNALPILLKVAADRSLPPPVRSQTIMSVGSIRNSASIKPLVPLLDDPDAGIRAMAAYALGDIGIADEESAAALLRLCEDPRLDCRHSAAAALAKIKDPRALKFLAGLLKEENDPGARVELIRALGELGGEEAVSTLTTLLESPKDRDLSKEIQDAINRARK